MPTSNYQCDLKVEVAFNAGFGTAAASRTWTDVSAYVELSAGINITHGRQDQRSVADANTLSLTLDNSDGRFTAGRATGAYYPNVKLYRPIRVTATTVAGDGAVTSTRFIGYVTSWPTEWDGTDAYSKAQITASSRLMRLGLNRSWKSIIEQNVLADSPVRYYTLGEPEGALVANDSSGNAGSPLAQSGSGTAVVFGQATGPGTDSLTAATFAAGTFLRGSGSYLGASAFTVEFFVNSSSSAAQTLLELREATTNLGLQVSMTSGQISAGLAGGLGGSAISPANSADGLTHHVAVTHDGALTISLYVDGVLANSSTSALNAITYTSLTELGVGGSVRSSTGGFTGVMAHVGIYGSVLSSTRIGDHAVSGSTGFAGETTDARFVRYTTLAGIPSAEVSAEASTITVGFIDTTDQQAVDVLRMVEATEAGVMFDDRDGTLRLHSRAHRYATSAVYTLNMAQHQVEADYAPTLDNTFIFNDVSVANVAGTYSAHVVDAASVTDYGVNAVSAETAAEDDDEPLNLANWWVYAFKDPRTRVPTLAVNVLSQVGKSPNSAAILATNVGDKITVSNQPAQAPASSTSYFVEGYTEVWGPESCVMTFNVSSTFPEDSVLVWGDATAGVWGTGAWAL